MIIKIGKYNEQNEIPEDILSGKYAIYAYNPLYWEWSNDMLDYIKETCHNRENFIAMLSNEEAHWGYEEK